MVAAVAAFGAKRSPSRRRMVDEYNDIKRSQSGGGKKKEDKAAKLPFGHYK